jgi:hypothetical protein
VFLTTVILIVGKLGQQKKLCTILLAIAASGVDDETYLCCSVALKECILSK